MSAALMHGSMVQAQPLPWTRVWRDSQALVVTVALHSAVVAFLVLGWSMEQSLPEPAPSTLKTRLVMLPAEHQKSHHGAVQGHADHQRLAVTPYPRPRQRLRTSPAAS